LPAPAEKAQAASPSGDQTARWSIAIHGGAGVIDRTRLTATQEAEFRAALEAALRMGGERLAEGGSALDVAETVARWLEDNPLFNAGRGAVFTAEGRNELDASIMDGRTRAAGAVASLTATRHPISAARKVMEVSGHVMLAGEGADAFAAAQGLEQVGPEWFFTEHRWEALMRRLTEDGRPLPPRPVFAKIPQAPVDLPSDEPSRGTIGVVVRDLAGDLAAATSTGGLTGKQWGRVGDAPVIGAGTYAQNGVCAVSATGAGEYFLRLSVARSLCALIELKGLSAQTAADQVIKKDLAALGGTGGVIVLGPSGEVVFSFNTPGMYRGHWVAGAEPETGIFADE
jgi:beta-aspartyl-peptidase (threonine type)